MSYFLKKVSSEKQSSQKSCLIWVLNCHDLWQKNLKIPISFHFFCQRNERNERLIKLSISNLNLAASHHNPFRKLSSVRAEIYSFRIRKRKEKRFTCFCLGFGPLPPFIFHPFSRQIQIIFLFSPILIIYSSSFLLNYLFAAMVSFSIWSSFTKKKKQKRRQPATVF